MSSPKFVFHVLGDSNLNKFLPIVKRAKTDSAIQDATFTRVVNAVQLKDALSSPKEATPTLIISALTNLLTSSYFEGFDSLKTFADRTFNEVLTWLVEGREFQAGFGAQVILLITCKVTYELLQW
jgi:hypothetical protein